MNNECKKCIYYVIEPDMSGSSYYMCDNKHYKSSWPEFTGECPYFKLKSNKVYKGEDNVKMRYTLECVKLNGDTEFYNNVHFINTSSKRVKMYFKEDVIGIAIKDYRYITIIPNKEDNNE